MHDKYFREVVDEIIKPSWEKYINELKHKWIGKKVVWNGQVYSVFDVDYNGNLLIPYKTQFNDTIAVYTPYNAVLAEEPYHTGLGGDQR
ncbi:MAG: hypothetical protein MR671_08715 [Clostridiales bacterium]|nr:hypothetical protein [Clostridiales bacterium]